LGYMVPEGLHTGCAEYSVNLKIYIVPVGFTDKIVSLC